MNPSSCELGVDVPRCSMPDGVVDGAGGWWRGGWRVAVVLGVAVGWAHGRVLQAAFYLDDEAHILHRETGRIANGMHYGFRWVTGLIWDAIYAVFGASSVAFHALNLVLHFLVAFGLWVVGRRLMERVVPSSRAGVAGVAALAGALLFATHPLMTEGVNYAQNASLQLVTLFVVVSIGCSLRFFETAKAGWVAGVAGCVALAAFTKEVGVVFVVLSTVLVWALIGGRAAWQTIRGNAHRLRWALYALVPAVLYFLGYAGRLAFYAVQAPMWAENVFTQGRLFWSYVRLMVWPTGLCSDHLVPFSGVGLADPWALVATVAVGFVVAALGIGLWTGKGRLACLLTLLGLIPLLLRFGYANKELFVEYRTYPALPWLALAAGWLVAPWLQRWRVAGAGVGLVVIGACAMASAERSRTWSDAGRLAEAAIRKYPNHIRARTHLQKLALDAGDYDRVVALRDESRRAFENLKAHNRSPGQARKYEASMPYRGYLCAEHFVAIALTERDGSQSGLRHAARIIEEQQGLHPEFFDPNSRYYEIVEQIVDIHSILVKNGAAYDERRQAAKEEAANASRQAATR